MSNAPFDTGLVADRLRLITGLQVGELAEYLLIKELRQFRTPSAFVVMAKETGNPSRSGHPGNTQRQVVEVLFGVVVAARNYRIDTRERANDLRQVVTSVRNQILGWTPNLPMARPCQFVNGEPLDSNDSTILWGEVYSTQHSIGS